MFFTFSIGENVLGSQSALFFKCQILYSTTEVHIQHNFTKHQTLLNPIYLRFRVSQIFYRASEVSILILIHLLIDKFHHLTNLLKVADRIELTEINLEVQFQQTGLSFCSIQLTCNEFYLLPHLAKNPYFSLCYFIACLRMIWTIAYDLEHFSFSSD